MAVDRVQSTAYRKYLLAALVVVTAFNYMDVVAFGMALQGIKVSLHLSDAELGALGGMAFGLFYATVGLVLGRWADIGNRVRIIMVTRVLWGTMVVLTGRAQSFIQMLSIRMGVAAGESGCLPPAYSFIGDYFSQGERPRALGILWLSTPCASILGYFASGWLIQGYGWRQMFTLIGVSGFVLAVIAQITLREPRREGSEGKGTSHDAAAGQKVGGEPAPLWKTCTRLYGNATYRNVVLAFMVAYFLNVGMAQWQATFFIRSYGMTTEKLGFWLAIIFGAPGIIGTYGGGAIASRWAAYNERRQLLMLAWLMCCDAVVMPFAIFDTKCSSCVLGPWSVCAGNKPCKCAGYRVAAKRGACSYACGIDHGFISSLQFDRDGHRACPYRCAK